MLLQTFFSEHSRWISGEADHFIAEATYDFTGENSDELSFKRGQNIRVAPKGTWCFFFHYYLFKMCDTYLESLWPGNLLPKMALYPHDEACSILESACPASVFP